MLSINVCVHLKADFCRDSGADSFTPGALAKHRCMHAMSATHSMHQGLVNGEVWGDFFK